jgi:pimeloyl-ACP methyl ester carboxylesterase/DNA-binding winged helix-turn-helix (wHTH) protein
MRYRFADRVLDTDTVELRSGPALLEVEPQVFDVLRYLVEHRDRVVTKEELLDNVWGNRYVSESALTTRIKQARQAVGDTGRAQSVIKTVHGRGYRFVAPVTKTGGPLANAPPLSPLQNLPGVTILPRTLYAEGDGASIAYQTFGEGRDVVLIAGFVTNVEVQWEHPAIAAFLRRLGSFARVTVLDKRGVGLSDRLRPDDPPSIETRADDLRAVMDAAGIEHATILGSSEGGSLAIVFTATHPERVERLALHATWARHHYFGQLRPDLEAIEQFWGTGGVYAALAPSLAADKAGRRFLARYERQSATPRTARALRELSGKIDVTGALASISVPTLVLHRRDDDRVPPDQGEQLVAGIPDARLVILEGGDHYLFSGDTGPLLDAIEEFVTGTPAAVASSARVLATVLFVDIVDSTSTASSLGDARWTALLHAFYEEAASVLDEHRGELITTTGDGIVATFDGPGRAVYAACALRAQVSPLGLHIRAGLHTAEIELRGRDIAGIGVHIASRVAAAAQPDEIWVSRTVTDLVAGTGLQFDERGTHALKGIDRPWTLYEVRA